MPYVSLYAQGTLRGCYGSTEGPPAERVARAFLLALSDRRSSGIEASERATLSAEIAYVTKAEPHRVDSARARFEPGRHGLALLREDGSTTLLLPAVARDRGYGAEQMMQVLAQKAGLGARELEGEGIVWLFETATVSSHGAEASDPKRAARRWLESLVLPSGEVTFELSSQNGAPSSQGAMRHGRIAVAIEALAALGSAKAASARRWLAKEIDRGLNGHAVLSWPESRDATLGTLALAARAGVKVPLAEFAASVDAGTVSPWHAGQAVAVLGTRAPTALWNRCVQSLETHPFAPYTVAGAWARGDAVVMARGVRALVDSIRTEAPFRGGSEVTKIPESALTAAAVEALAPIRDRDARKAVQHARGFLLQHQILDVPAAMHPCALGAFRASPVTNLLRCDVTAHAALALFGNSGP